MENLWIKWISACLLNGPSCNSELYNHCNPSLQKGVYVCMDMWNFHNYSVITSATTSGLLLAPDWQPKQPMKSHECTHNRIYDQSRWDRTLTSQIYLRKPQQFCAVSFSGSSWHKRVTFGDKRLLCGMKICSFLTDCITFNFHTRRKVTTRCNLLAPNLRY